jgi:hypothetical protein
MDVFLIPTMTSERYELYYEAPDEEVVDPVEGTPDGSHGHTGFKSSWAWRYSFGFIGGVVHRMKLRFSEALREAEEWRHRRHEMAPEPAGMIARWRRKVMGFVVERIAEQRLLWHLRTANVVCARIPTDLTEADADEIIRAILKKDGDHHRKWFWIDGLLLLASAPLVVIPGPNVPGFYFTFQVVGHYLSWSGAKQGVSISPWDFQPCQELADVRAAFALPPAQRQRRFHDLAARLRLEHLTTFLEDVAAPPA